jgi:hypothetical protein
MKNIFTPLFYTCSFTMLADVSVSDKEVLLKIYNQLTARIGNQMGFKLLIHGMVYKA